MFSGIVQHLGVVAALEPHALGRVLSVDPRRWVHQAAPGESIAVNGCCLTVTPPEDEAAERRLRFDVIRQTLDTTTLGDVRVGDVVNLEAPLPLSGLVSGHLVQGHVDGVGVVRWIGDKGEERRLRIGPPPALLGLIVEKGSIAVDGVSLTVAALGDSWFEVALIPTTIALTSLGRLEEGDRVNIETDYIVKAVVHWLMKNR